MILFMWALFVALNGRLTLEIALFGLGIALAVFAFMCLFLDWGIGREVRLLLRGPKLAIYALRLWLEIAKANFETLRFIYAGKRPESVIVTIRPALNKRWQRWLLANSITLTPGTITMECDDDKMVVHCLDRSMAGGLEGSGMEGQIAKMEAGS